MVRLISAIQPDGSAVVVKRKIDEQALTRRIVDISQQYRDLLRLKVAVRKAELEVSRTSWPGSQCRNKSDRNDGSR
jgi:hypothetical protein